MHYFKKSRLNVLLYVCVYVCACVRMCTCGCMCVCVYIDVPCMWSEVDGGYFLKNHSLSYEVRKGPLLETRAHLAHVTSLDGPLAPEIASL